LNDGVLGQFSEVLLENSGAVNEGTGVIEGAYVAFDDAEGIRVEPSPVAPASVTNRLVEFT